MTASRLRWRRQHLLGHHGDHADAAGGHGLEYKYIIKDGAGT
jgi:hypothetical protein